MNVHLQLPDELGRRAAQEAAATGVSLDTFVADAVASVLDWNAEQERIFTERRARATRGQARDILAKIGTGNHPFPGDELD